MAALMHVIGTRWLDGHLRLRVAHDAALQDIALAGDFRWHIGRRTCIGYWNDGWHPCPDAIEVGHESQCLLCFRGRGDPARRDDQPDCIFEPKCLGVPERCICSFGGATEPVPHVVYCAFYGGLPKVGMTMARRVETRLTEQGADAYFVIQEVADRQAARRLEKQVAMLYGLPEWRRHDEVFPQLTRPVDWDRVAAAVEQWMIDLSVRYDVQDWHRIEHHLAPLPGRPQRVPVPGAHAGRWLGAKGAHLFYQGLEGLFGAPVLALKRGELMGRWIEAD